jgi:hypothetical protein
VLRRLAGDPVLVAVETTVVRHGEPIDLGAPLEVRHRRARGVRAGQARSASASSFIATAFSAFVQGVPPIGNTNGRDPPKSGQESRARLLAPHPFTPKGVSRTALATERVKADRLGVAADRGQAEAYFERDAERRKACTGVELPVLPLASTAVTRQ